MARFLIDIPMMASLWVTADREEDALKTVNVETKYVDLRLELGTGTAPAVLFQICRTGPPDVIEVEEE